LSDEDGLAAPEPPPPPALFRVFDEIGIIDQLSGAQRSRARFRMIRPRRSSPG
jgi:hypothetical protein